MQQKVAVVVWTVDPEGAVRFLLRHNKPFHGYTDEWTIVFGGIEPEEPAKQAAAREAFEEYGLAHGYAVHDLQYMTQYVGKRGPTEVHYFALHVPDIEVRIVLNEESIGYDWVILKRARKLMIHPEEFRALERTLEVGRL